MSRPTASASWPERSTPEPLRADELAGAPWHRWLLVTAASAYGIYLGFATGYIPLLLFGDPTKLTLAVGVLYLVATSYIGYQVYELSLQHRAVLACMRGEPVPASSWVGDYLRERRGLRGADATALGDLLHERIKGRTEFGWFSAGLHIKLGLLGTVIGFVIMLGSIGSASDLQSQGLDTLVRGMGVGMRVSLYHTIAGLIGSMMIGLQMLVVDRVTDRLFALIITLPEDGAGDDPARPAH
ncbi:MAG: MotA/TolQ/ExbB proton channel family protein [Nevskia sp.]